jgi:hypothetical protein
MPRRVPLDERGSLEAAVLAIRRPPGAGAAGAAAADEVLFLNGDRLTGKIISATGGKLTIKTEAAGELTVDLTKVKTFSTDEPVTLKTGDTLLRSKVAVPTAACRWCRCRAARPTCSRSGT